MELGLIHYYYGYGKGKTSAAVGLAVRARGHNKKVLITSFLKDFKSGEYSAIRNSNLSIDICDTSCICGFLSEMTAEEKAQVKLAQTEMFLNVIKKSENENYDVLILDEIIDAIDLKCVNINQLISFLYNKPKGLEVVLTGHSYNKYIFEIADYVTEFKNSKHPYQRGICARYGIDK